jgi:hypothetical protein
VAMVGATAEVVVEKVLNRKDGKTGLLLVH